MLRGYDIDGTLTTGLQPKEPYVVISGRTFSEYNEITKNLASKAPVYIRGSGKYGDQEHAAKFKAIMINMLKVDEYYEDDPIQINIIKSLTDCTIFQVFPNGTTQQIK